MCAWNTGLIRGSHVSFMLYIWWVSQFSPKWNSSTRGVDGDEDCANDEVLNENDESNECLMDFDPSLVPILEGFNNDDEVLVSSK